VKDPLDGTPGYDQPFCIRGAKGRFWHGYTSSGYIPASKLPEEEPIIEKTVIRQTIVIDKKAMELLNRIVALENQSHTHTDKKTNKYKRYI